MSWKDACGCWPIVPSVVWQHHCHALSCLLRSAWHPSAYFHAEVSKAPVIACPASMTLTEGDTVTIGSGPFSAMDPNAGDSAEIACTSSGSPVGAFSGLAVGSHTVTCTATDMKGLSNSCDIAVTVESGALAILKLPSQCMHTCHASELPQSAAAKAHLVKYHRMCPPSECQAKNPTAVLNFP
jgi:HYR domain